jgi:II/X family phage/plasmid replication protein
MIDWGLVLFPIIHHPIDSGVVFSVAPDGEIEWRAPKRIQVVGSYEKKISVKSVGGDGTGLATHLWVQGNPSKFLQGHNVFGSDDIVSLMADLFDVIAPKLNLIPSENELYRIKTGDYELKTVDINYSYELPCRADVLNFIRALEFKSKTRHGRPSKKGGTLYFGKNSKRWAIKFYCKAEEIQTANGRLPHELQNVGIENWVENKLRIELRLLSKELIELGIVNVKDVMTIKARSLFDKYVGRINMSEQIALSDEKKMNLPTKLRSTYTLWIEGHDLRSMMSKATYYRHCLELKEFGINIDLRPESTKKSNVVPLIRILEAKPASIPNFAFERGLIHRSAAM